METAIAVRTDFSSQKLRRLATRVKNAAQARRLLAIAAVLDSAAREEAAKIGGMDRQTLRDWMIRVNDLIMRLHELFGIAVSDDTVYRALKELGFSHVSARPKSYKQDPEAMEAFKKTFPPAWPRSALSLRLAHR